MNFEDVLSCLDRVEDQEGRLLAWGLVHGAFTETELLSLIEETSDEDPQRILRELKKRRLLFEVPRSSPPTYRSRMAEAVRLFTSLRQLFPGTPWATSPRLVADFR